MADNTFIQKPLGITLTFFGFLWGMCVLVLDWTGRLDALKHLLPEEAYSYLASVKLPLLPLVAGIAILISLRRKGVEAPPVSTPQLQTNTNTATANPMQTVNVYTHPQPERQSISATDSWISKHNTRFLRHEDIKITVDESDDEVMVETQARGGAARVARFRNTGVAGEPVSKFSSVRAHVIYRDAMGTELADVPAACWLGHRTDMIDLEVGRTETVVIAAPKIGDLVAWWTRRIPAADFWTEERFVIEEAVIPRGATSAEVQLIGEKGISMEPVLIPLPDSLKN
jgi:hypothetical protein